MTIYVVICSGNFTDTINGEAMMADKVELIKASKDYSALIAELETGKVQPSEPDKWGVCAIGVYPVEFPS